MLIWAHLQAVALLFEMMDQTLAQANMMTENNSDRILNLSESVKSVTKEFRNLWARELMSLAEQIIKLGLD